MTDKEAELLRAVVDAAAAMIVRWDKEGMANVSELRTFTHALSAYRAQPQEATGEMVTMGLIRSRLSGTLIGTMTPEDEDPRDWGHIGNIVFPMPPAIVIPTIPAKVVT